jgi:Xaa-Pro aminopeptidase
MLVLNLRSLSIGGIKMKDFFIENRKTFLEGLRDNSIVVLFSGKAPHRSRDAYYKYDVDKNFYYLTGLERENLIYMAIKSTSEAQEYLFIEKSDPILEKWVGKKLSPEEAQDISGVKTVLFKEELKPKLNSIVQSTTTAPGRIYLDLFRNSPEDASSTANIFAAYIKDSYPHIQIRDCSKKIAGQRLIKSDWEVENIKKAVSITKSAYELMLQKSPFCTYEYQVEAYLDFCFKLNGADHAFETIAASGKNAAVLHYVKNNSPLSKEDLILLDFGARYKNYCADVSRTFPVGGRFSDKQKKIYSVVLDTLKETSKMMKPDISMKEVNDFARSMLAKGALDIGLIKEEAQISDYYYHGIGHPLGLDTHDVGDRDIILKPGMVFTCEPGLYIESEGIGVRIEDDILITNDGNENLTKDLIKEIEEIETFMDK